MVSIAFVDQELTLFYPTKHNTVHSFALHGNEAYISHGPIV